MVSGIWMVMVFYGGFVCNIIFLFYCFCFLSFLCFMVFLFFGFLFVFGSVVVICEKKEVLYMYGSTF